MATTASGFNVSGDETQVRLAEVRRELARLNELAQSIPVLERRLAERRAGAPETPYRAANAGELQRELDLARAARLDRKNLRLEEASLMRKMEADRRILEGTGIRRVTLPKLENVEIAAPCPMSWADMDGDTDVRYCGKCKKQVFNLSMMSREEAEAVLGVSEGKGLCVRLFRRDDGTVLTQDCSVGVARQRFWRRTKGIASAGMIAAGLGMLAYGYFASHCVVQQAGTAGAMSELTPG